MTCFALSRAPRWQRHALSLALALAHPPLQKKPTPPNHHTHTADVPGPSGVREFVRELVEMLKRTGVDCASPPVIFLERGYGASDPPDSLERSERSPLAFHLTGLLPRSLRLRLTPPPLSPPTHPPNTTHTDTRQHVEYAAEQAQAQSGKP